MTEVPEHEQAESHRYVVHFPPHPARENDPHYADFDHYHRQTRGTARCYIGERIGYADCRDAKGTPCPPPEGGGKQPGLELHHAHVEFSLQNGISLAALERDFPGISDPSQVGAWVESDQNFRWLCVFHHRGPGGAHTAAHSDWEGSQYVLGLISKELAVVRLAAIISLVLAVIFYAWNLAHHPWTWTLWMLLGLLLWCISESHPKVP